MTSTQKVKEGKESNLKKSEAKCECGHGSKPRANERNTANLDNDLNLDVAQLTDRTQSSISNASNEEKKLFRTPRVKSEKATTKPLHLGKEDVDSFWNTCTLHVRRLFAMG